MNRLAFITVLNSKGLSNIDAVEYYDGSTKVKSIEAIIYNSLGSELKKIKRKDFIDQSVADGFSVYSDNRMIYLDYNDTQYTNIDYMMRLNNGLTIRDDYHNLGETPPKDSHPSKKCHRIIADAVIKKIESL